MSIYINVESRIKKNKYIIYRFFLIIIVLLFTYGALRVWHEIITIISLVYSFLVNFTDRVYFFIF